MMDMMVVGRVGVEAKGRRAKVGGGLAERNADSGNAKRKLLWKLCSLGTYLTCSD